MGIGGGEKHVQSPWKNNISTVVRKEKLEHKEGLRGTKSENPNSGPGNQGRSGVSRGGRCTVRKGQGIKQ